MTGFDSGTIFCKDRQQAEGIDAGKVAIIRGVIDGYGMLVVIFDIMEAGNVLLKGRRQR